MKWRGDLRWNVCIITDLQSRTRWFKYDRDKLWLVYTQIVPVIFEPPCSLYVGYCILCCIIVISFMCFALCYVQLLVLFFYSVYVWFLVLCVLLSILSVLYIVSPHVHDCFFSICVQVFALCYVLFTDHCHRVETQLQLINTYFVNIHHVVSDAKCK